MTDFSIELLEKAIQHAKTTEPQHANRRAAALLFVRLETAELRKEGRFQEAVWAGLLYQGMKRWSSLMSLLEALRQRGGIRIPEAVPPICNTGVNSPQEPPISQIGALQRQEPLSDKDKSSLTDFIAGVG